MCPCTVWHKWGTGAAAAAMLSHLLAGRADDALLLLGLGLVVAAGAAAALPDDALAHAV